MSPPPNIALTSFSTICSSNSLVCFLYFSNSLIYGNNNVSLINNSTNATYNNLIFNGTIYSNSNEKTNTTNINDIEITENNTTVSIENESLPIGSKINTVTLKGVLEGNSLTINSKLIAPGNFEISFEETSTYLH